METADAHHGTAGCGMPTTADAEDNRAERGLCRETRISRGAYTTRITATTVIAAEEPILGACIERAFYNCAARFTHNELLMVLEVNVDTECAVDQSSSCLGFPRWPIKRGDRI